MGVKDINIAKLNKLQIMKFPANRNMLLSYINAYEKKEKINKFYPAITELESIMKDKYSNVVEPKPMDLNDRFWFIAYALAMNHDTNIKRSIDVLFRVYLRTIPGNETIADIELDRALLYSMTFNIGDISRVTVTLERIWRLLLTITKEYDLDALIVYVYLAMFANKDVPLYAKYLASHLTTTKQATYYSNVYKIKGTIDVIIKVMLEEMGEIICSDNNMNVIQNYAHVATIIATIAYSQCACCYDADLHIGLMEIADSYLNAARIIIDDYCN